MISVKIIAVGNLKDRFFTDACAEYVKRLGAYSKIEIIEIKEARLSPEPSAAEISAALREESERIFTAMPARSYKVAMCIEGVQMSSEKFASDIIGRAVASYPCLCFVIGGSFGLDGSIKAACDAKLSMSMMTFPHRLARVMLLEAIYRGFSILNNGHYHK